MDAIILSYTRGQVNAESLLRKVHAAQEVLEARVGAEAGLLQGVPAIIWITFRVARQSPIALCSTLGSFCHL